MVRITTGPERKRQELQQRRLAGAEGKPVTATPARTDQKTDEPATQNRPGRFRKKSK